MSRKLILLTLLFILASVQGSVIWAQSSSEESDAEGEANAEMQYDESLAASEEGGYIHADVIGVRPDAKLLLVKENRYNFNPYAFEVTDTTTFEGTASLSSIKNGDKVEIDYSVINGKRVADNVVIEEEAFETAPAGKTQEEAGEILKD